MVWTKLVKIGKKAAQYAVIAFSGYEIGSSINSKDKVVEKTIIRETQKSDEIDTSSIFAVIASMSLIAIFFVSIQYIFKCTKKTTTTTKLEAVQVQQVQQQQPEQSHQPKNEIQMQPISRKLWKKNENKTKERK